MNNFKRRKSTPPVTHNPSQASITTYVECDAAAPLIASAPLVTLFLFTSILYSASMRRNNSGWTAALKDARMKSSSTRSRSAEMYVSWSIAALRASFSRFSTASLCLRAASSRACLSLSSCSASLRAFFSLSFCSARSRACLCLSSRSANV